MTQRFIMGYGSLMNKGSRIKTGETGIAIPVQVHNRTRHWSQDGKVNITSVTVQSGDGKVNGVIVPISEKDWGKFETREANYTLAKVDPQDIEVYGADAPNGPIYICESPVVKPAPERPIVDSYLDVLMQGALEIGQKLNDKDYEFARGLIKTTLGWAAPYVNDRKNPVYTRSPIRYPDQELVDRIDGIVRETLQDQISHKLDYRPDCVEDMVETVSK